MRSRGDRGFEDLMRGTIRWFDARRGFGFIVPQDGGPDVFVHRRVLQLSAHLRRLEPGQVVEYEAVQTAQGTKATQVTVLAGVSASPGGAAQPPTVS